MKALGLLLLVVIGFVGFLSWRSANIERQERDRARAEAMLAEMRAADAPKAANATPGPGRKVTLDPATKRYVEHDANASVTQSRAGGAGSEPPRKGTAAEEARKQFGWDGKGTSLDKATKR